MVYYIVNPVAGSGKALEAVPVIKRLMDENGADYSIIYTEKPGDSTRVSRLIDFNAVSTIVCVGGDGTLQEYVGLAIENDVNLGVIPVGSANDLLYSLPRSFTRFRTQEEKTAYYTQRVLQGKTIDIDAVSVNDRYFLNIAGTGADIHVLREALPLKRFFGSAAYFIALIKTVITYTAEKMTLVIDEESESGELLLIAICNGAYYGGNMKIAPPSVIDDGLLTICKVKKMLKLKLMAMFPRIKSGGHTRIKEVSFVNCSTIKLEYNGKKTINLDGNLFEMESPLIFKVLKNAVSFII